jgi:MoxR-like ATPase
MKITQIKPILKLATIADDSVLISGLHGIGKSEIVSQFASEANSYLEILFTSLVDETDLLGLPDKSGVSTVWLEPVFITRMHDNAFNYECIDDIDATDDFIDFLITKPHRNRIDIENAYQEYYGLSGRNLLTTTDAKVKCKNTQKVVFFLDELNRANPSVLNASLQLILSKKLNDHELPTGTNIISAINPSDLDYSVLDLDPALLDRFIIIDAELDIEGWIEYASSKGISRSIIEFIIEHQDRLHYTPESGTGTSPRSWIKLDSFIKEIDKQNSGVEDFITLNICTGKLGKIVGTQFFAFWKDFSKVLKLEDVIKKIKSIQKKQKVCTPETVGKELSKFLEKNEVEPILLNDWCQQMYNASDLNDIKSNSDLYSLLYAIKMETLASFILKNKDEDMNKFLKFVAIDNDKGLVRKIKGNIKNAGKR